MRLALGYAEHMMRNAGSIPPTLIADTEEGIMLYLPDKMGDERAKQNFANTARLVAVGYRASAVAFVLESWATFAKSGKPLDKTPPSQSTDREECVIISLESADQKATKLLVIERDGSGKFVGFGTRQLPDLTDFQGRFSGIMPPKPPGEKDALMAKQLLKVMGVEPEHRGFNPMWN